MANCALLNNVDHRDLRVITRGGVEYGDGLASVPVFPTEFGDVQREYPIFFRKDEDVGRYSAVALLGFEEGENLFLGPEGWSSRYVPGMLARGPFLIGFQQQDGAEDREPVIHIDLDNPRLSRTEGEPIFLEHGGNSRYIEGVASILDGMLEGAAVSDAMFQAFNALDLLEPVSVEVEIDAITHYDLRGLHTINEERLRALEGAALESLNRAGFLQMAFLVLASTGNIRSLIALRSARRSSPAAT